MNIMGLDSRYFRLNQSAKICHCDILKRESVALLFHREPLPLAKRNNSHIPRHCKTCLWQSEIIRIFPVIAKLAFDKAK